LNTQIAENLELYCNKRSPLTGRHAANENWSPHISSKTKKYEGISSYLFKHLGIAGILIGNDVMDVTIEPHTRETGGNYQNWPLRTKTLYRKSKILDPVASRRVYPCSLVFSRTDC